MTNNKKEDWQDYYKKQYQEKITREENKKKPKKSRGLHSPEGLWSQMQIIHKRPSPDLLFYFP